MAKPCQAGLKIRQFAVSVAGMLQDRDYMRRQPAGMRWPATIALLVVNVAVWVLQYSILPRFSAAFPFEDYFALSLDGLRSGHYWQLLTYQFMHGPFWHLFFNSWAIFVFGRPVESALGTGRMLGLYFLSGVMGGLLQMLCSGVLPGHFGIEPIVGASAGAFGLVAAFAVLAPNQRLLMLLFFVIPLAMRAKTLLWLSVALAVAGMIIPYGNIGHAAHLGGIVTGFVVARLMVPRATAAAFY